MQRIFQVVAALGCLAGLVEAREVVVDLVVSEETLAPAGHRAQALTFNGSIPGPVLRFRVGDTAVIRVQNNLRAEGTSIHWHGLLVPNEQDGVPHLTTDPIPPGGSHIYRFPLTHAGTYWYHSHQGLQEQRGLYGAIVVSPQGGERISTDRDEVLVLSDWTTESTTEIMRTLMRGSDWYSLRKGTAQSILGAALTGNLRNYFEREWSRLPAMDISDVAYDAFLVNGQPRIDLTSRPGERVRLRVINAGAATYFYIQSAAGPLQIISNDGMDVRPIKQNRLLIGIGETYDLLFTTPPAGQWELRATAQDGSGFASAFIGSGQQHDAPNIAPIDPYDMASSLQGVLDALDETEAASDTQALAAESERPISPYRRLQSVRPTAISPQHPRRDMDLHLTGNMMRYSWEFNGKRLKEDSTIKVTRGEVLRLHLINDTMMHHPIHLHGHFFRLVMDGEKADPNAPLKHTVDVPPMARRTIEFLANEQKDWFFHCHLLYHMEAGMARVISYDDQGQDHQPNIFCDCLPTHFTYFEASLLSNMTTGMLSHMGPDDSLSLDWNIGWQEVERTEYETTALYTRYLDDYFSASAGFRLTNRPGEEHRALVGLHHLLPLLVQASATVDSEGDIRVGLAKNWQITSRLHLLTEVEYDTNTRWEWALQAGFTITKRLALTARYDSDYGFGGGFTLRF